MKNKSLLSIALTAMFLTTACEDRLSRDIKQGYVESTIDFNVAEVTNIDKLFYAHKRLFNDFNCDGTKDMFAIEIKKESGVSAYVGTFYQGYISEENTLKFQDASASISIPIPTSQKKKLSDLSLDSIQLNTDKCSDIVAYSLGDKNKYSIDFVVNNDNVILESKDRMKNVDQAFNEKKYYNDSMKNLKENTLNFIAKMKKRYDFNERLDSSAYLSQKWCDMDANGLDDSIVLWKSNDSLSILIGYSSPYKNSEFNEFKKFETHRIDNFLFNRDIEDLEVGYFDSDKVCEIISYRKTRHLLQLNIAKFKDGGFVPEQRVNLRMPADLDMLSSATKFAILDRNNDNKDDLNLITEISGDQVVVTWSAH